MKERTPRRIYMAQAQARFRKRMKELREWKESLKLKKPIRIQKHRTADVFQ